MAEGSHVETSPPIRSLRFSAHRLEQFLRFGRAAVHPEYRGKPLAVVPTMADTTCCIAASYEAKALGIKTVTQVGEAKRLCPEISSSRATTPIRGVLPQDPKAVDAAARSRTRPLSTRWSASSRPRAGAAASALHRARIKQAIKDDVGETLRCSIGMAPNRYLAKIASDMQKPTALSACCLAAPRAIAHLELRDLPGVGARTEERLTRRASPPCTQLLALDRPGMHTLWDSVWGDRMYHWLRGAVPGTTAHPPRRHPEVARPLARLGPEHRTPAGAWAVAHKLLHKAAMRLRMEDFHTGSMRCHHPLPAHTASPGCAARKKVKEAFQRHPTPAGAWRRASRLPGHALAARSLRSLWANARRAGVPRPFFVGVTLRNLIPEERAPGRALWRPGNRAELSATMDKLNLKYGHPRCTSPGCFRARSAPTRIAFTQIPVQYGVDYM